MLIKQNYITFILYLFIPFCAFDTLNGFYIMQGGHSSISILYKSILISLLLVPLLKNLFIVIAISILLLSFIFQLSEYTINFYEDISISIRTLFFIIASIFFIKNKKILTYKHYKILKSIFIINFIVISLNVFVGIFGLGYTTYGSIPVENSIGLGFKGFFYAGNELGPLFLCMYPVVLSTIKEYNSLNKRLILNIIFLMISFLIGTKTSFLGSIILVSIDLLLVIKKRKAKGLIFLFFIALFSSLLLTYFNAHIETKLESLHLSLNEKGLLYLIFSGRESFLLDSLSFINNNFSIKEYIFGIGASYASSHFKSVEIDLIDLFVWNGLIWVSIIYGFFIYYVFKVISTVKEERIIYLISFILMFFISLSAGHIFTSAMLLPILSLYFPYNYLKTTLENHKQND